MQGQQKQVLKHILSKFKETRDILDEQELFDSLCTSLANSPDLSLTSFEVFLQYQCGVKPRIISRVTRQLYSELRIKQIFDIRISFLLIKHSLYEAFQVLSIRARQQRATISKIIDKYANKLSFEELIEQTAKAIDMRLTQQEIHEIKEYVAEGKTQLLEVCQEKPGLNSLEQQIKNSINDFKLYPKNSLQKAIQLQKILCYKYQYPMLSDMIISLLPEIKKQKSNFNKLNQLASEYFDGKDFCKLQQNLSGSQTLRLLENIKAKASVINVFQLQRLIDKTESIKKIISNREIILFIGQTGSGKSTAILKFLGYNLKKALLNGLQTYIPQNLSEQHMQLITSPQAKSCTRYINAVRIPNKMYGKGVAQYKNTLLLCDSPGFGDSGGVQVDIANGVGMINALREAKSVRIVLMLPYQSIINNRGYQIMKICQLIESLLSSKQLSLHPLRICFNKIPTKKINQIPWFLKQVIENLGLEERNSKAYHILKHIYKSSKNRDNYLDINADYCDVQNMLTKIIFMEPILDPKQILKYSFTSLTNYQIRNFFFMRQTRINKLIQKQSFEQAKFQLQTAQKLKSILKQKQDIHVNCFKINDVINRYAEEKIKSLEQLISYIINGKDDDKIRSQAKSVINNLKSVERQFHQYLQSYEISQNIRLIIDQKERELINLFKGDISKAKTSLIPIINNFIECFGGKAKNQILFEQKRNYQSNLSLINQNLSQIKHQDMKKYLQIIKKSNHFIEALQKNNEEQYSKDPQINKIKSFLQNKVQQSFLIVEEILNQNHIKKIEGQKVINLLSQITQIQCLDLQSQNDFKTSDLILVKIRNRCEKLITNLTAKFEKPYIKMDYSTQLKRSMSEIQNWMKIKQIRCQFQVDFIDVKKIVMKTFEKYINVLMDLNLITYSDNQYLENLDSFQQIIDFLKKNISEMKWEGYSQIINQAREIFENHLSFSGIFIRRISINLRKSSKQYQNSIINFFKKIQLYEKIGDALSINKDKIFDIKKQFKNLLQQQLRQMKSKQIISLKKKQHFRYLNYYLKKLDNFAQFFFEIDVLVKDSFYKQVFQEANDIQKILEPHSSQIKKEYVRFLEAQPQLFCQQKQIQKITQAIEIILKINNQHHARLYFQILFCFDFSEILSDLKHKFIKIGQYIKQKALISSQEQLKTCKLFIRLEEICQKNQYFLGDFTFRQLYKFIQKQSINQDLRQMKKIIKDNKLQIDFEDFVFYYRQFDIRSNNNIILAVDEQLKNMQNPIQSIQSEYQKIKKQNSNLSFSQNQQVDYLIKRLKINSNKISNLEGQSKSKINLEKINAKRIIEMFIEQFQAIHEQLCQLNTINLDRKLEKFGQIQKIIEVIIAIQVKKNVEKSKQKYEYPHYLKKIIFKNKLLLINQIKLNQSTKKEWMRNINQTTIKQLFMAYKNQSFVKNRKYLDSKCFAIDQEFEKYYSCIEDEKSQTKIRQKLCQNIEIYFKDIFYKFQQSYGNEKHLQNIIASEIQKSISRLPNKLKQQYQELFLQRKNKLESLVYVNIFKICLKIKQNPSQINNYLLEFQKMPNNSCFREKSLQLIRRIYDQKIHACQSIRQKAQCIEKYFFNVTKYYLQTNKLFSQLFKEKLFFIVQKFVQQVQKAFNPLNNSFMSFINDMERAYQIIKYINNDQLFSQEQGIVGKICRDYQRQISRMIKFHYMRLEGAFNQNEKASRIISSTDEENHMLFEFWAKKNLYISKQERDKPNFSHLPLKVNQKVLQPNVSSSQSSKKRL